MKLNFTALLGAGAFLALSANMAMAQDRPASKPPGAPHERPLPMDTNKDGSISRDEWMTAAAARFDRFDVSKDGKISPEELRFGMFEAHRPHHGPMGGPGGWGGPDHRFGPPPPPPQGGPAPEAPSSGN